MQNKRGFTLIEVVVVTVIIAVLALVVLPSFKNSTLTNQMEKAKVGLVEFTTAVRLYNEVNSETPIDGVFNEVMHHSLTDNDDPQGYVYLQNSQRWMYRTGTEEYSLKDATSEGGVLKCRYIIEWFDDIISRALCEFNKIDEEGTLCYSFYIQKNNPAVVKKELLEESACAVL